MMNRKDIGLFMTLGECVEEKCRCGDCHAGGKQSRREGETDMCVGSHMERITLMVSSNAWVCVWDRREYICK